VKRYFVAFLLHYQRINDWKKIIQRVERGELKIIRLRQIRSLVSEKMERHFLEYTEKSLQAKNDSDHETKTPQYSFMQVLEHSWQAMTLNYGTAGKKGYTEEEDAFLIFMMYKHGYLNVERIRLEIRRAWQFRFDWYFKSRTSQDIHKRCDFVIRLLEKELEEIKKKEEADEKYRDLGEVMVQSE
jgi:SWI/SNF-related matrix-associated actin-dependent regulator of chromatin subfamily A member 5